MEFCPHCMQPSMGEVCARCGGQINWTAAPGQLPLGTLLRGAEGHTYQIGAARGQGGFGITYAAMDLTDAQRVAIKEYYPTRCALRTQLNQVMPMTGQDDVYRGGMKSFLEEAMMLSAVGALPSVVTVRDYFEANGTAYLVMEFVDGVPLHQIVNKNGTMSAGELLPKLPELLTDLDTLHRAGIIHRDISPDNLILMPNGKLKLLDFGSARSVQDGKSMTVLLKAGFSPVEQYQSRGQGAWTDVYALAATVYYCLTGVIPPSAVDRLDEDTLQKPNALGAGLTAGQEEALVWGLVVQPKSRPASMDIFRQRLFPGPHGGTGGNPPPGPDPYTKPKDTGNGAENAAKDAAKDAASGAEGPAGADAAAQETPPIIGGKHGIPPKPDKKKKILKRVLIGLGGLAALVALVAGIYYLFTHGTTDDGYVYRLEFGGYYEHAVITGYEGEGGAIVIPEEIRDLSVEYIDGAFERRTDITSVTLHPKVFPWSNIFYGCSGITLVIFDGEGYSAWEWEVVLDDCQNLRCVFFTDAAAYEDCIEGEYLADLEGVVLCHKGQDTGFGLIKSVEVVDDIVYALTDAQYAVILQMPDALDGDTLSPALGAFTVILPDGRIPGQVDPIEGVTSDGYSYYISADRSECVITGYTGSDDILTMPDEIEGYPVNIIGENAFAGNNTVISVFFPLELDQIMDRAFEDCVNLKDIYLYSEFTYASSAFTGCDALRCAVLETDDAAISTAHLPSEFKVYRDGMETGIGALDYVGVSTLGTIYGVTHDKRAVVLDIADDTTKLALIETVYDYPLEWVCADAVEGLSADAVIILPATTLIDPDIWNKADWDFPDEDSVTLAKCWYFSCYLRARILDRRDTPGMELDRDLTIAAILRAYELSLSDSHTRPNGESWSTVLDEYDIAWTYASTWRDAYNTSEGEDEFVSDLEWLVDTYAAPEEDYDNKYYTSIALGLFLDESADTLYLCCLATMND